MPCAGEARAYDVSASVLHGGNDTCRMALGHYAAGVGWRTIVELNIGTVGGGGGGVHSGMIDHYEKRDGGERDTRVLCTVTTEQRRVEIYAYTLHLVYAKYNCMYN